MEQYLAGMFVCWILFTFGWMIYTNKTSHGRGVDVFFSLVEGFLCALLWPLALLFVGVGLVAFGLFKLYIKIVGE